MWGGWGAFDWRVPVLLLVGVGEATSCRHSNVTVVSDRNTPVRIGHAQLLSCLANRKYKINAGGYLCRQLNQSLDIFQLFKLSNWLSGWLWLVGEGCVGRGGERVILA